jgi:hypothetical protein
MLRRTLLLFALSLVVSCGKLTPRSKGPPARASAPAFTLAAHTGEQVSLADLTKSGPAVLVFYRGYW